LWINSQMDLYNSKFCYWKKMFINKNTSKFFLFCVKKNVNQKLFWSKKILFLYNKKKYFI
jgi:hypothetical protein